MAEVVISQEELMEMLEKLPDGTFKIKYPKTKASQVIGLDIATKSEAEEGVVNDKFMTPLRVREAIDSRGYVFGTYIGDGVANRIINVGFTPSAVYIEHPQSNNDHLEYVRGGFAMNGFPIKNTGGAVIIEVVTGGFKLAVERVNRVYSDPYRYIAYR